MLGSTRMARRKDATRPTLASTIAAIERHHAVLVYPVANRHDPLSLWEVLYPGEPMRWAWDASADDRVVALWHLRERIARSERVVYGKLLGGRATFLSSALARAVLATLRDAGDLRSGLSPASLAVLEVLSDNSPEPTRRLREAAGLAGRAQESAFQRAMRPLWERLLVVGVGEVDEGGFPSLAVGATQLLRESLWNEASTVREEDRRLVAQVEQASPAFARVMKRVRAALEAAAARFSG